MSSSNGSSILEGDEPYAGRTSPRDAVGRRIPRELTQSPRFFRARIRMMWVLLVGSAPQSLAKHTMEKTS